jgi:hypothetical protein
VWYADVKFGVAECEVDLNWSRWCKAAAEVTTQRECEVWCEKGDILQCDDALGGRQLF